MKTRKKFAALSGVKKDPEANIKKSDLAGEMQAGPRSTQSTSLNYMSVQTLDPVRLARAFSSADQGEITEQAKLFELIEEHNPHVFAELSKRRRAVTQLGWQIVPKDDAPQSELDRSAELQDMIAEIDAIEDAFYDLTDAIGKCFTALEIEWGTGSVWLPKKLHLVPQYDFRVDIKTGKLMYLNMGLPEPLKPGVWFIHEHRAKSGYLEKAALFRVLAWIYAYKMYNVMDMQRFLETYGMPLRLGKYPDGISEKQRNELLRAVRNIGNDGAGVVPQSMLIEFIEAQGGKIEDFLSSIEYWERKESIAILGSTLTTQADGKSSTNALGLIHDKVRTEILMHDVKQIEPSINKGLVQRIVGINGMFKTGRMPSFKFDTEEGVDQEKVALVFEKAVNMGMEIEVDYAHKALQIPRAAKGKPILTAPIRQYRVDEDMVRGREALSQAALSRTPVDGGPTLGQLTDQLAAKSAPHEEAIIQQVYAALAESGDFDEAITRIEQLNINLDKYAELLGSGMTAAHLAGRSDVKGGN